MSTYQPGQRASDQQRMASKFLELPYSVIMQTLGLCTTQTTKSKFQNINSTLDEYLELPQITRMLKFTADMNVSVFSQSPCLQEIIFSHIKLQLSVTRVVASSCLQLTQLTIVFCAFVDENLLEPFKHSPRLKTLKISMCSLNSSLEHVRDFRSLENVQLDRTWEDIPAFVRLSETWTRMKTIRIEPFPADHLPALIDRNQSTLENFTVVCIEEVDQAILNSLSHCPNLKYLNLDSHGYEEPPAPLLEFPQHFPKLNYFFYTDVLGYSANMDAFFSTQQHLESIVMCLTETDQQTKIDHRRMLSKLPRLKYLTYGNEFDTLPFDQYTQMLHTTSPQLEVLIVYAEFITAISNAELCGDLQCLRVIWLKDPLPLTTSKKDYFQKFPKLQVIIHDRGRKFAQKYDGRIREGFSHLFRLWEITPTRMKTLLSFLDVGKLPYHCTI